MYSDWVGFAAWGLLVIWLGLLSFLIWQQNKFLTSLFPKSGERDVRKKFEEILKVVEDFKGELSDLGSRVKAVQSQSLQHIQRVGFLRFNPYNDTGGDQSFAVCFLDNEGTGIVITSLHARSGTRAFGKEIILGKSAKYELSKEEELVIKKAMTER
ncbi:DUF4446 family protein [Patescibacteria group bacterium]|nr:DUF4446 family protein [Patescibacteria group bacterium]